MIYFDAGATTLQKPLSVPLAAARAIRRCASPGRGAHAPALRAADVVYECRSALAALFAAQPEQVVFTMNATHALNLAIKTLARSGDEVVVSGFEHNSVRRPLHALGARVIVAGRKLFDPGDTLRAFSSAITARTRLVVCTHVSNVFGYILPVEEIAALCRARGVPFVLDASQSAGILPVRLRELQADFIAMPGHKGLYGPQGTGVLLCARTPEPLLEGGSGSASREAGMPRALPDRAEAGTQNAAGIAGLLAGVRFVQRRTPQAIFLHECALRAAACRALGALAEVRVFCGPHQAGTLCFLPRSVPCEQLAARLSEAGICLRAGLHCAPLAHESAGTLESGTLRLSFSAFNTHAEVRAFAARLKKML